MRMYFFRVFFFVIIILTNCVLFAQNNIKDITILHWNDLHARNLPYKVSKKDSTGQNVSYIVGGTSNMLGYIEKFRDNKTLLLNGGDDYQGSPISTITRGFSQIELLNLFNLDAFVIGNHEFDYGQYALDSALQKANFDYLSANVYNLDKGKTFGKPHVIKEIDGVKIGIIGLTALDLMTLVLPKGIPEVVMLNTDSVVSAGINYLKENKCDLIVLLTHIGTENDKKIAEKFSQDIDIIIGGHSHTPLFKPVITSGVIICQAGSYSRWLGKVNLKVDTEKDTVLNFRSELIETVMDSSIYNREAQAKVESMIAEIQPQLMRVIGKLETDWKRSYTEESNLGQWQADAIKKKTQTDISLLNAGGIRKDLMKGDITVGDVWEISPFGNTIVTFTVSGSTLKQMIKNNIKTRVKEIEELGSSDMIVVSGLNIVYDSRKILNGDEDFVISIKVNGEDLKENQRYSISTNNYVGSQFVKYFGNVEEQININDTNIIDRDLLIEAIEEQKVINSNLEKRVIDISNQKLKDNH